jgi:hypothetical protein
MELIALDATRRRGVPAGGAAAMSLHFALDQT